MSEKIEFTDHSGEAWFKYTCSYTDADGKRFGIELWATSDADAQKRVEAARKTLQVDGRIAMLIDAHSDEVLADSTIPENTTGVTH
jgi:hypothetical protein